MKAKTQPAKGKKPAAVPEEVAAFTKATLFVSKSYPAWQNAILKYMADKVAAGGIPENNVVSVDLKVCRCARVQLIPRPSRRLCRS
jgi:hypothetical protein